MPPESRGRPRSAKADAAIIEAAIALFAEAGIEGASIEQIAQRAGVTRATIYRRWASKEELLAHALAQVRHNEQEPDWSAIDAEGLVRYMSETAPAVLARPDFGQLVASLLGASIAQPGLIDTYWRSQMAPRREAFARAVSEMKRSGRLGENVNSEILQDILAGALIYRSLVRKGPKTQKEWAAYCGDLLRTLGLNPPAPRSGG